jgi:hypothetical protein
MAEQASRMTEIHRVADKAPVINDPCSIHRRSIWKNGLRHENER